MKRKIEIEIENASVCDLDALTIGLKPVIIENVKNFNNLNNRKLTVTEVGYAPIIRSSSEKKSEEIFPVEIVNKKDKRKPLKSAYIRGANDAMVLIGERYKNGMQPEDIFGIEQDTKEPSEDCAFDFHEATSALLSGKSVRRKSWNENLYITCNSDRSIVRLYNHTDTGDDLLNIGERFSFEDTIANDWEIYRK